MQLFQDGSGEPPRMRCETRRLPRMMASCRADRRAAWMAVASSLMRSRSPAAIAVLNMAHSTRRCAEAVSGRSDAV
jgi:hypothetical protein